MSSGGGSSSSFEFCGYCFSTGHLLSVYGHSKHNCPRLAALRPCVYCNASGVNNHTKSHCPLKPKVRLELKKNRGH